MIQIRTINFYFLTCDWAKKRCMRIYDLDHINSSALIADAKADGWHITDHGSYCGFHAPKPVSRPIP